jgi:DNA-binding protein HU-beta
MSKSAIAAELAESLDVPKKLGAQFLEELAELAHKEAKNGFMLPGIGKLVLVHRKARMGRNPATGESIRIPAKKVVKFRVAKACKDSVLGGAGAKKKTKKKAKKKKG